MGADSIDPFLDADGRRGIFVLCKTSNKTSNELQSLKLACSGEHLFEHVAKLSELKWGRRHAPGESTIGLVVGATDVNALRCVRVAAPKAWILAPGVGAQGGNLEDVLDAGFRKEDASGILITVSRGISRSKDPKITAENLAVKIIHARRTFRALRKNDEEKEVDESEVSSSLLPFQRTFINTALNLDVLRFGSFVLKSGRISPYFFNAGLFRTGTAMNVLSQSYAMAIERAGIKFDVLFGPAYKGIPLVCSVAMTISRMTGKELAFAYNRKEKKDHGEGGMLVGAELKGQRVLIVDDVITAGTAIREAIRMLVGVGAKPVAVALALDRQEVVQDGCDDSAVEVLAKEHELDVVSVITLRDLSAYVKHDASMMKHFESIAAYRSRYGSKSSAPGRSY